jgi:acyl-coenzyme A thioesterase PaaI-like protein
MGYASLDPTVKFLRRITVDTGKVRAVGTVLNGGRRTVLAEATLIDGEDRLLAHTTISRMRIPPPARSQT